MQDIKVIDNFLPSTIQDQIEKLAIDSNIKFGYTNYTTYSLFHDPKFQDGSQLVSKFIEDGQFLIGDVSHFFLLPLQIVCLQEKFNLNLQGVIRAKVNLKFKQESKLDNFINPPHVDNNIENSLIGIYYINDSDGDTVIYEDRDLKISKTIEPKKGRMILMDGSNVHSASHPLKTKTRMVINYNFIV
jgi:hypothetical protein